MNFQVGLWRVEYDDIVRRFETLQKDYEGAKTFFSNRFKEALEQKEEEIKMEKLGKELGKEVFKKLYTCEISP